MTQTDLDLWSFESLIDADSEQYGRHAQWHRVEQFSVWDLFGEHVGRHRTERPPFTEEWALSMWVESYRLTVEELMSEYTPEEEYAFTEALRE